MQSKLSGFQVKTLVNSKQTLYESIFTLYESILRTSSTQLEDIIMTQQYRKSVKGYKWLYCMPTLQSQRCKAEVVEEMQD